MYAEKEMCARKKREEGGLIKKIDRSVNEIKNDISQYKCIPSNTAKLQNVGPKFSSFRPLLSYPGVATPVLRISSRVRGSLWYKRIHTNCLNAIQCERRDRVRGLAGVRSRALFLFIKSDVLKFKMIIFHHSPIKFYIQKGRVKNKVTIKRASVLFLQNYVQVDNIPILQDNKPLT